MRKNRALDRKMNIKNLYTSNEKHRISPELLKIFGEMVKGIRDE